MLFWAVPRVPNNQYMAPVVVTAAMRESPMEEAQEVAEAEEEKEEEGRTTDAFER